MKNLWQTRPAPGSLGPFNPESTLDFQALQSVATASGSTKLRFGVISDKGNVREQNEDNFYVPMRPASGVGPSPQGPNNHQGQHGHEDGPASPDPEGLFLVADGMGGQLAGEEASRMAVELVSKELARKLGPDFDDLATQLAIRSAVARANEEILARSHLDSNFANMGTTLALALFHLGRAYVAGIGDSRAYRLRDGCLEQLTEDHSMAKALEKAGTIRPDEVSTHKYNHILYNYLGSREAREGPEEIQVLDCRPGDQILLCSDGLTGVVTDGMIVELLQACADPQQAAQALVRRALENRSKDNITCVVIRVEEQ